MAIDIRGDLGLEGNPSIELDDLLRVEDPCVIFEGEHLDSDGVLSYVYSVGGWLDGRPLGKPDHVRRSVKGCMVGGDCIVVQAKNREEADAIAADGLDFTIAKHREAVLARAVDRSLNQGIIVHAEARPKKH